MDGVGWLCHMFYRADAIDNVIGQVRRLNYFVGLQRINRAGEQSSDNCLHELRQIAMSLVSLADGALVRATRTLLHQPAIQERDHEHGKQG